MGDSLYFIAVLLAIGWLIAVFGFEMGGDIHFLLIIAVGITLTRLFLGRKWKGKIR